MDFRVTALDLSLSNAFKVGHCCGTESNEWNVHYRLVENKRVILYFFYKLKMKIYELWNGLLLCVSACRSRIEFRCHPAVIGPNTNLERRSCRMLYTTGSRWWSVTGTISDVKTLVFIFLLLNSRSRWLRSGQCLRPSPRTWASVESSPCETSELERLHGWCEMVFIPHQNIPKWTLSLTMFTSEQVLCKRTQPLASHFVWNLLPTTALLNFLWSRNSLFQQQSLISIQFFIVICYAAHRLHIFETFTFESANLCVSAENISTRGHSEQTKYVGRSCRP